MILVSCSPGHVAAAVSDALERLDESARRAERGADLSAEAAGCRAIVYVPEPRLLEVGARGAAGIARVGEVMRAAQAPGIERVVVVLPAAAHPVEDERALRETDGCTLVRSAPLVDELADATNLHTARSVWLARGRHIELTSRPALARSIRAALLWNELRGASVGVPSERMEMAEAMRRAAAIAGATVKVHATVPAVSRVVRMLYGWLGVRPEAETLCDRLGAQADAIA